MNDQSAFFRRRPPTGTAAMTAAPVRLICRHSSRLLLARAQRWAPLMPAERLAGLVVQTVLSAGIAHLPYRDPASGAWIGIDVAPDRARPTAVMAVRRSLELPYASIARRVDELVAAGTLLKERRGVRVAPALFGDGAMARVAAADRAELAETIALLAAAGHDPAPALRDGGLARLPAPVVERALLAFSLRALESVKQLYGDVVSGMVAVTIIAANVEHLTQDPALDRLFVDQETPPPDALRRAIPVRELARRMEMPFETVRRRVSDLRARDLVELHDDGIVLPARVLLREAQLADNRRMAGHFHWLLATLADLAGGER